MPELPRLDGGYGSLNSVCGGEDAAEIVGREFENWQAASGEILLIADVLVGRDEEIELRLGKRNQFSVFTPPRPRFWVVVQS